MELFCLLLTPTATSLKTNSAHLPACGPLATPQGLGNPNQASRIMSATSEKCQKGRQEDRTLIEVRLCLQMQMPLKKPSRVG